jgi:hypothetical protein
MKTRVEKRNAEAEPTLTEYRRLRKSELKRKAVKKFLSEPACMERDQWFSWSSAVSARLASSPGVDHGRLFAALEDEVRAQLRYFSEKPLET